MRFCSHCQLSEPSAPEAFSSGKQIEDSSLRIRLLEENVTRLQEALVSANSLSIIARS